MEVVAAWKSLETDGTEWLAENRKVDQLRTIGWHRYEAAEAEARSDWFAAAFHLQRLLENDPTDTDLQRRLATAKRMRTAGASIRGQSENSMTLNGGRQTSGYLQ
jgi:hypothetical protein